MVVKIREEKLKEGEINNEGIDEVEFPADEKSNWWKVAVLSYSLAVPLVISGPMMFIFFGEQMWKGETCKFYELAQVAEENA